MARPIARQFDALRQHRAVWTPSWSIADQLAGLASKARQNAQRLGGLGQAWAVVIPENLQARSQPISMKRGQLHVRVADASTQFELDRFLRSGGLSRLIESGGGVASSRGIGPAEGAWAIRRVVFEHGPIGVDEPAPTRADARRADRVETSKRRAQRSSTPKRRRPETGS
jgi:Dna[CI] antecedent, DciA